MLTSSMLYRYVRSQTQDLHPPFTYLAICFASKLSGRAPYLAGASAHKTSRQLWPLAGISGLLGHGEIISIHHSDGQEVWRVAKCLVVKNSLKKDQALGSGNSSQETQRMPLKTKKPNQSNKKTPNPTQHYKRLGQWKLRLRKCLNFPCCQMKFCIFLYSKEEWKEQSVTIFDIYFRWLADQDSIDISMLSVRGWQKQDLYRRALDK